jgi:hypothetical protein
MDTSEKVKTKNYNRLTSVDLQHKIIYNPLLGGVIMAKKLKLENFNVQSFTTELDYHQKNKLRGGVTETMAAETNCVYATCNCPSEVSCIQTNVHFACMCKPAPW